MNKPYWQDGKWHESQPPMDADLMCDLEVKLQEAIDKCPDPAVCLLIEEAAQVVSIRLLKDEFQEEAVAA